MAQTLEDLFQVELDVRAFVSLDKERIEADPVWRQCLMLANDDAQLALENYLMHYLERERFLRDVPSTNGPGRLELKNWKIE